MKERIYPVLLVIVIILVLYLVGSRISPEIIQEWTKSAGAMGPLLIIVLGAIAGVFAPMSGTPLLYVGFALYGSHVVFLLTASSLISAAVNFHISKKWGRPLIMRIIGEANMKSVDRFTKEHGVISLFFLRVFMGSVNDFISYAIGLTNMKFNTYYAVTAFAAIPGVIIWYAIAVNSQTPLMFTIYTSIFIGAFGLIFVVGKLIANKFHK